MLQSFLVTVYSHTGLITLEAFLFVPGARLTDLVVTRRPEASVQLLAKSISGASRYTSFTATLIILNKPTQRLCAFINSTINNVSDLAAEVKR
jgi:hypothetical protein